MTDRLAILCRAVLNQEMDLNIVNLDGKRVLRSRFQATEGGQFLTDIPPDISSRTCNVPRSETQGRLGYSTKSIRR
ncbi:MAG: hypothetical protein K1X49_08835 [Saprospiraceae bacterium]|nr:hypothetical protein [Saprospiraceae bacterium]